MKRTSIVLPLVFALVCIAMNAYSSYDYGRVKMFAANDSVVADSSIVKNDSTVASKDSIKTSKDSKKREYKLRVGFEVKDFLTHQGVDSVEAELLLAADSSFLDSAKFSAYRYDDKLHSDVYGEISKPGNYILRLRADGYRTLYYHFSIPKLHKRESWRELKTAYMHKLPKEREIDLNEVVVKATKLKFYMDGDTLVYDADAFNLAEGSMLDELIRRLPGVTLNKDGEITANGQKVEALLLNGKDFFDSDRNLMLENLPSYMVNNVQVFERTPENVKGTIKEKSTKKELVMNVKLKKEYNGGWIANAEVGAGTPYKDNWSGERDTKFLGRFLVLHFNDKSRFSLFANANNLNDHRNPGSENGEWEALRQSDGLTTSYKVGMNGMLQFGEDNRYQGSLTGSYSDIMNENMSNNTTFLIDEKNSARKDIHTKSSYAKRSYDYRIASSQDLRLRGTGPFLGVLKSPYLYISGNFTYLNWDNLVNNASVSLSEDVSSQLGKSWLDSIKGSVNSELLKKYAIDKNITTTKGIGHITSVNVGSYAYASPLYNDNIGFTLDMRYRYNDQRDYDYQHYLLEHPQTGAASQFQNKYTPSFNTSHDGRVYFDVAFGIGEYQSIELVDGLNITSKESNRHLYMLQKLEDWNNADKNPLGTLPSMEEQLQVLDSYNSTVQSESNVTHSPTIKYSYSKFNGDNGVIFVNVSLHLPMNYERLKYWQGFQADTTLTRKTVFFSPDIYIMKQNPKKGMQISAYGGMSVSAPSLRYMLDVRDTSDLKAKTINNPNLKNTVNYYLDTSYRDKFGRVLFNASGRFDIIQNAVANKRVIDATNFTTSTQENVNGNWRASASSGMDLPLCKDDKFRLRTDVSYSFNNSVDLSGVDSLSIVRSVVKNHNTRGGLGLTYRPSDKMLFTTKGDISWQASTGSRAEFSAINAFTFNYGMTAQVELPWSMQLSTDLTMYSRRGYDDESMNTNELVWNARLSKRLMKGNLIIQLDGFDLLGNLSNVYRSVNAQGKYETFYNVIPSYCLLHAIWRLNKQPKKTQQ